MLPGDFPSIIPTKPNRKDMVKFGKGGTKYFVATAIQARKIGMSVKDVGGLENQLGKRESKEFLEKLSTGESR